MTKVKADDTKVRVLCALCKKPRDSHNARNNACPVGRKNRTLGYTQFHHTNVWQVASTWTLNAAEEVRPVHDRGHIREPVRWPAVPWCPRPEAP